MVREKYQNFSEEENEKSKYVTAKDIEIFLKKMVTSDTKISQNMEPKT